MKNQKPKANKSKRQRRLSPVTLLGHDHDCHCGTATHTPHKIGEDGCVRLMAKSPRKVSCADDRWMVDGHNITGYSMRDQRGYHQHPCGCWSRSPESTNSIEA